MRLIDGELYKVRIKRLGDDAWKWAVYRGETLEGKLCFSPTNSKMRDVFFLKIQLRGNVEERD